MFVSTSITIVRLIGGQTTGERCQRLVHNAVLIIYELFSCQSFFLPFSLFLVNGIKFTRKVSGIKRICCPVLFGTAVRYKTVGVSGIIRILHNCSQIQPYTSALKELCLPCWSSASSPIPSLSVPLFYSWSF